MFGFIDGLTSDREIDELEALTRHLSRQNIIESDNNFFNRVVSFYSWLKSKNDYKFDDYKLNIAIESIVRVKFDHISFDENYINERSMFRSKVIESLSSAPSSILLNFRLYLYMIILLASIGFGIIVSNFEIKYLGLPLAAMFLLIQTFVYLFLDKRRKLYFFQKVVDSETKKSIPISVALIIFFGLVGFLS